MQLNDQLFTYNEKLIFQLRELYASYDYRFFRMSEFEEYSFYMENKDFLVSDQVLTFTDTNGKLMALKPDVTLSIINNRKDEPDRIHKIYYNENVYRSSKRTLSFKEILQTGIECFGNIDDKQIVEVITMALRSLQCISRDHLLVLSDLSLSETVIKNFELSFLRQKELFKILKEKRSHELQSFFKDDPADQRNIRLLETLMECDGDIASVFPKLSSLYEELKLNAQSLSIFKELIDLGYGEKIRFDSSLIDDINYYNGIIFKGYIYADPEPILSGGQYDRLMEKLRKRSKAIGFAVYTGLIEEGSQTKPDDYLNIALPKGRLGEKVYSLFEKAGYDCKEILEDNRKLIFENTEKKIRFFLVKPSDVTIYVERGTADIGVAGKDTILENKAAVYELLDLKTGICRMAVAAPKDFKDDPNKVLKVATKFENIAKDYYRSIGRKIDIINLNGSIEIAPVSGLSDVIVDIVETGKTLKENGLEVKETITDISARLIANRSAYEFKSEKINSLTDALSDLTR